MADKGRGQRTGGARRGANDAGDAGSQQGMHNKLRQAKQSKGRPELELAIRATQGATGGNPKHVERTESVTAWGGNCTPYSRGWCGGCSRLGAAARPSVCLQHCLSAWLTLACVTLVSLTLGATYTVARAWRALLVGAAPGHARSRQATPRQATDPASKRNVRPSFVPCCTYTLGGSAREIQLCFFVGMKNKICASSVLYTPRRC